MVRFKDMVQWQTVLGEPVAAGGAVLTPQAQVLAVRWPGGGWVWSRPVAILVDRDGTRERVPIADVTRVVQWALLGLSAGFFLMTLIGRGNTK